TTIRKADMIQCDRQPRCSTFRARKEHVTKRGARVGILPDQDEPRSLVANDFAETDKSSPRCPERTPASPEVRDGLERAEAHEERPRQTDDDILSRHRAVIRDQREKEDHGEYCAWATRGICEDQARPGCLLRNRTG